MSTFRQKRESLIAGGQFVSEASMPAMRRLVAEHVLAKQAIQDMALLIKRLCLNPSEKAKHQSLDYLRQNNLMGDLLREDAEVRQESDGRQMLFTHPRPQEYLAKINPLLATEKIKE